MNTDNRSSGDRAISRWVLQISSCLFYGCAACLAAVSLMGASDAHAYEADVHYGLTKWLALQAGFEVWQAEAIALGNVRVDSGLMSTLSVVMDYGCLAQDQSIALTMQERHFPSAVAVPAPTDVRVVVSGSSAARSQLSELLRKAAGREAQHLGLFGAALHPLQDSWAHAGIQSALPKALGCNEQLAGVPQGSSEAGPHSADHASRSAADFLVMAQATYEALVAFPAVQGQRRTPRAWAELIGDARRFSSNTTKTAMKNWFIAHGLPETGFLEATTLPDGPDPGTLHFVAREVPDLPNVVSMQYETQSSAKSFFDQLLIQWAGSARVEDVVKHFAVGAASTVKSRADAVQLVGRLKLWKLHDHGMSARLAHLARPMTSKELREVDMLASRPHAYINVPPEKALFPMVAIGATPSPLLPYVLRTFPAAPGLSPRVVAVLRLRHAPYDTLGLIAEQAGPTWVLKDVIAVLDR